MWTKTNDIQFINYKTATEIEKNIIMNNGLYDALNNLIISVRKNIFPKLDDLFDSNILAFHLLDVKYDLNYNAKLSSILFGIIKNKLLNYIYYNTVRKYEDINDVIVDNISGGYIENVKDNDIDFSINKISENINGEEIQQLKHYLESTTNFDNRFNIMSKLKKIRVTKNNHNTPKTIYQYDLDGNFIKEYYSIQNAMKVLSNNHICNCCRGARKTAGGYQFCYKGEEDKIKKISGRMNKAKSVFQYDLDGNFIKEFNSIIQGVNKLKIYKIGDCCRGVRKTAGGYQFCFKGEEHNIKISI